MGQGRFSGNLLEMLRAAFSSEDPKPSSQMVPRREKAGGERAGSKVSAPNRVG